jgi:DNA invertase Pin-like site-specific DNA recombinase
VARLLGYARIPTTEQHLDLQRDALRQAGCERVFADTATGALDERPQLAKVLAALRPGDTLVV